MNPFGGSPFGGGPFGGGPFGGGPFGGGPFGGGPFGGGPFGGGPFGNPFAGPNPFGGGPPGILPYMGAGNPWSMPFGYNPYDPYGTNPFATMFGPGFNPYGGAMSPFGPGYPYAGPMAGSPFGAPAVLPYMGSNPYGGGYPFGTPYGPGYGYPYGGMPGGGFPGGGIPNYGFQNPWSMPLGSPVGSFFSQIDQLNRQMQMIQGGGLYGGGFGGYGLGGSPPAILPYMGTPMYNQPGTMLNPGPPRGPSGPPQVISPAH
jgi:hypothetical protein